MTIKVNLVVEGFDIFSDAVEDLPETLCAATWRVQRGLTLAVLYVESDPVVAASTFARTLEHAGLGKVVRVDEEFVNISDVATRLEVSRETVRTWVVGTRGSGDFPRPHHTLSDTGGKSAMKVWRWADVNSWLKRLTLDDGWDYPTDLQCADIEAHLHRLPEPVSTEWQDASRGHVSESIMVGLLGSGLVDADLVYAKRVGLGRLPAAAKVSTYRQLSKQVHVKTYS